MNTLLLIDLQNDFLPGGALAVREGDQVIPLANRLMPRFDLVIASQDWHPANHDSFAANHPGKKVGELIELASMPQILWPAHCVQNTSGADFAPALDRTRIAHITKKGTDPAIDSYSAFFDNGRKKATDLDAFLRARGITHLHLLGIATDYCVLFTALDARKLGYRVTLIEDACRGVNLHPKDVANAFDKMRQAGVEITTSNEILQPQKLQSLQQGRISIQPQTITVPSPMSQPIQLRSMANAGRRRSIISRCRSSTMRRSVTRFEMKVPR